VKAAWQAAATGLLAAVAWGVVAQTPAASAAADPTLSPLLGALLGRVAEVTPKQATGDAPPGLFNRLSRQVRAEASPTTAAAASAAAMTPALGFAMEQLDPRSFAVLRPIPVAGSGPLLKTGDVFVLHFSTNLPGQVRLENTDAAGRVADLGTYTVLVDQLNRLPRDKGIQLQGQPGLERLRFYFYPCLPAEATGKPWASEFQGKLPACPAAAARPVAGGYGSVVPRALVNLAQPDATMAFAGASDYRPGEMTLMEARIRHEARSNAR
jgi:hypothetical protein